MGSKKLKIGRGLTNKPRAGWKKTTKTGAEGRVTKYTFVDPKLERPSTARAKTPERGPPDRSAEKSSAKAVSQRLHMRRCHLCDTVSEQHGDVVSKCDGCGKNMAPFYFFNEAQVEVITDREPRPENPELTRLSKERLPIRGLTAYW